MPDVDLHDLTTSLRIMPVQTFTNTQTVM